MNNLDILIRFLDRQLKYADGIFELNPDLEYQVVNLWYNKYRPAFEKIVYKI